MNREQEQSSQARLDANGFRCQLNSLVSSQDCNIAVRHDLFTCSLDRARLGELDALKYSGYGLGRLRRRYTHIIEDEIDSFLLSFSLTDPFAISQSGQSTVAEAGKCVLFPSTKPYELFCGCPGDYTYSGFLVKVPGSLLRREVPYIDDCCPRPIAMHRGAGKILRSLIEYVVEDRSDYSDSQAVRFGTILLNTLANFVLEVPELEEFQGLRPNPTHSRIFECAKTFIDSNLSNSKLDTAMVADHCHISMRYLQAIFAASSQSVGAIIREMRLQRCREALQNPSSENKSIIEIARRWGFNSSSSFNHAYRARFGKSPSEDRV